MDWDVPRPDPDVKVKEEELDEDSYDELTSFNPLEYHIDILKNEEDDIVTIQNNDNTELVIQLPTGDEEAQNSKYVSDDQTDEPNSPEQSDEEWSDAHKKFECKLCGKSYAQSSSLYRHMVQHNNKKSYECENCGKQFFRRYNLVRHMSGKRNCKKECHLCHRVFATHELLITHVLSHRSKEVESNLDGESVAGPGGDGVVSVTNTSVATPGTDSNVSNDVHSSSTMSCREVKLPDELSKKKPLQCVSCVKTFVNKMAMIRHMYTHAGLKPHKCAHCQRSFARRSQLTRHEKRHQTREYKECSICHKTFLNMKNHLLYHEKERPSKCEICHTTFRYRHELLRHRQSSPTCAKSDQNMKKDGGRSRLFECDECGKTYKEKNALSRHKKTHAEIRPYQCDRCGKGFFRRYNLHRHFSSSMCKKGKSCKLCGVIFVERDMLFNHVREHFNTHVEICGRCGDPFRSVEELKDHEKTHHSDRLALEYYFKYSNSWVLSENLPCNLPGKSVVSQYLKLIDKAEAELLAADVQHEVQDEGSRKNDSALPKRSEMITCTECHQTFTKLRSLARHVKTNCGKNKPYKCSKCKKSFARNYGLVRHMKSHNSTRSQEKCPRCDKLVFNLKFHMARHDSEQYTCQVCNAGFSFKLELLAHEKSHSGAKKETHVCDVCGAVYRQSGSLMRHKKLHEDDVGKFKCNTCDKTFHRKWNLLRHLEQKSCGF